MELLSQFAVDDSWLKLFGYVGVVGALIWYLWYRTAVTDPKRDETFTTTIDKITERHDASIREVVDKFDENLRQERDARRSDLMSLKESLRCRANTGMGS